jgi:hypothetical protein
MHRSLKDALTASLARVILGPNSDDNEDGSTAVLTTIAGEVPELVFHYTSAAALRDIATSRVLWASNARFLNDTTEMVYGLTACRDRLNNHGGSPEVRHFLGTAATILDMALDAEDPRGFDVFVACFSDGRDIIPQWRGYGADGAGYALGFAFPDVAGVADADPLRVVYLKEVQDEILDAAIEGYAGAFERSIRANPDDEEAAAQAVGLSLATLLIRLSAAFKNEMFAHEREWRLVTFMRRDQPPRPLKFRASHGSVVPYVEMALEASDGGFPLREIVCGPTVLAVGVDSAKYLVSRTGLKCVVRRSAAPLRS